MDARFVELLPWYVNGTLSGDDRQWVERVLREDPAAQAELAWFRSLSQKILDDAPAVSDDVGLARAMQRIHAEAPAPRTAQAKARTRGAAPGLLQGLMQALQMWLAPLRLSPALVLAMLVIVVQGGFLLHTVLPQAHDGAEVRSLPAGPSVEGRLFRVSFKPTATEADIRLLLIEVQGNIESGPGQLGDYYVRVPAVNLPEVTAKLKSSAVVDGVMAVDAVPARGQ